MILIPIFLAILYIALAVMFIALSIVVFIGKVKLKPTIEKIKNAPKVKIEIKRVEKSHIKQGL